MSDQHPPTAVMRRRTVLAGVVMALLLIVAPASLAATAVTPEPVVGEAMSEGPQDVAGAAAAPAADPAPTPAPRGEVPFTGLDQRWALVGGVLLVGLGIGLYAAAARVGPGMRVRNQ